MKLRHVRAVAVFVGVVVALTGARHSSGAGCSGHSSNSDSSSHSSTGGSGSHNDDDDSVSGSGGVSETTLGEATRDLTIAECKVEDGSLVADVRATNSSTSETYSYMFQVAFKAASGTTAATGSSGIFSLAPGATDSALVTASSTVTDGTCELVDPQRISAS